MPHSHPVERAREGRGCSACRSTHSLFVTRKLQQIFLRFFKAYADCASLIKDDGSEIPCITSGCQHWWICCCVYCPCWHFATICDSTQEISACAESVRSLPVITIRRVPEHLQRTTRNHCLSGMTEQLISHIYVSAFIYAYLTCIYDHDCILMI